jgi:WD40 repeat protein
MTKLKDFLKSQNRQEQLRVLDIIRLYSNGGDQQEWREKAYEYLTTFEFIEAKLSILNVDEVIKDYQLILGSRLSLSDSQRQVLHLISKAIAQSSNILEYDKHQLPGILLGKLLSLDQPALKPFLEQIKDWEDYSWLKPLRISLYSPVDSLLRTLAGGNYFQAMAINLDGTFAITTGDGLIKKWDLKTGKLLQTLHIKETYKKLRELLVGLSSFRDYTEEHVNSITQEEMRRNIAFGVIAISPDGNWLATGSAHSNRLYSYNSDSKSSYKSAVSIEAEYTIFELWDLENERSVLCFGAGLRDRINSIALSYHAKNAVIGNVYSLVFIDITKIAHNNQYLNDGHILIRSDMEASSQSIGNELDGINAVAISDDNHWIVAGNKTFIKIWNINKGRLHSIIPLDSINIGGIGFIKFSGKNELLFSSVNGEIYRISLDSHFEKDFINHFEIERLSQYVDKILKRNNLYFPYMLGHYGFSSNRDNYFKLNIRVRSAPNLLYDCIAKYTYNLVRNIVHYVFKRRTLAIKKLSIKAPDNIFLYDITPDCTLSICSSNDGGIELWNL